MKKTAIKPLTKDHIQRRKMWRDRFLKSTTKMLTAPGCNSDDYKAETAKAAAKVAAWGGVRGQRILLAVQRRALRGTGK